MKLNKTWVIAVTVGSAGLLCVIVIIGIYFFTNRTSTAPGTSQNNNNPSVSYLPVTVKPQSDLHISEAFATAWLGYLTPGDKGATSPNRTLHYTITGTVNWNSSKPMQSAKITDIAIETPLSGYKILVFPRTHLKNDDYPSGIPIADMYPDGMLNWRNELNNIPNSGTTINIPVSSIQNMPEFQDEITTTNGYYYFRIKLYDFAVIKMDDLLEGGNYNTKAAKILAAAGLTKGDLSATVHFTLKATFTDGSSDSVPITIVLDGGKYGDYGMDRQDYQK